MSYQFVSKTPLSCQINYSLLLVFVVAAASLWISHSSGLGVLVGIAFLWVCVMAIQERLYPTHEGATVQASARRHQHVDGGVFKKERPRQTFPMSPRVLDGGNCKLEQNRMTKFKQKL